MKKNKQIHIVFRMDDYSAISNTELELKVIDLFQKKKVGITFGVIPFVCAGDERETSSQNLIRLTREKGDILKTKIESGFLDIALHGYSHQVNTSKESSEFAGLDYDSQVERLSKGRHALEEMTGTLVKNFIPPWNQYDKNTLQALEELGFKILSAGWTGVVEKESKIRFVPATCGLNTLRDAVKAARTSFDEQPLIVVLFHQYDFIELKDKRGNISLQELSDLLDWLSSQRDLRLMSINQVDEFIADLSAHRFFMLEQWRSVERFLPLMFREKKPIMLYHEAGVLSKTRFKVGIYYGIIGVLVAIGAFIIGLWFFSLSPLFAKTVTYGCILAMVGVIVYAFKDMEVSPKGLMASLAAIGACTGIVSVYLLRKWM